jgi:hypothetical protein
MITAASQTFSIFAPFHMNIPDAATEMAEWTIGVRSLRSQGNLRLWNSYLPRDCVNTMIKMGWDKTA